MFVLLLCFRVCILQKLYRFIVVLFSISLFMCNPETKNNTSPPGHTLIFMAIDVKKLNVN